MPQKTNLNVSPYFEDFDPQKNYYKVLFRPGYSVQSRELTTLQSVLQNQIESYGRFRFKQGELVIPGEVGLNTKLDYVKLSSVSEVAVNENGNIVFKKYDIKSLVGLQVRGISSGVIANVVSASYATTAEADTLFVKYVSGGDSATEETFRQGETLEVVDGVNTPLLIVGTDGSVLPTTIGVTNPDTDEETFLASPAMGYATALKVEEGIYFVNGYFVRNDKSLLIVDKYYDKPSAKIGFSINEQIITPEEDASLYDNARGFTNASAPGAHRLKISLELNKYGYKETTEKNFIQIVQIKSGVIEKKVKPADYSLLEETLARRTYDESGDYIVKDFPIDIREYYQRDGNNGIYKANSDGLVNGLSAEEASQKMIASIGSGKAYVRGFEIVDKETKYIEIDKARDTLTRDNVTIKSSGLPTFKVSNVYGNVPLNTVGDELTAYPDVYLNSIFNDGTIGGNGTSFVYKNTISRRSKKFDLSEGIKTVYVKLLGDLPQTPADYPSILWYVKTRDGQVPSSVDYVDVIGTSLIKRTDVEGISDQYYAEITVIGEKAVLDAYFIEYDDGDGGKNRYLYETEADALAASATYYGIIKDYNEIITPIIGLAKPKNFYLERRGEGFNQDTDIVLSRGRSGLSDTPYNAVFNFSYFNPVFFTRITLEDSADTGFSTGKYIVGKTSKAYGVIESDDTGNYTTGNILFVTTLSGEFKPGETILDEDGNSAKIAIENTISHFIVTKRGENYNINSTLIINGDEIPNSKVAVNSLGGRVYRINIIDRTALRREYSAPPEVNVTPLADTDANKAYVIPVLFKNTVLTFTPQNVKSFSSEYNSYKFTADADLNDSRYSEYTQVTSFTFSGKQGRKYLECDGFGAFLSKIVVQGDIVQYTDPATNVVVKNIVQSTTDPIGVNKSRIYLDYALTSDVTNASIIRVRPRINNLSASLVFPTGSKEVRSLVKDSSNSKIKYYVRKDFTTDLSASGGTITFTAQLPAGRQRFVTYSENNFILTVLDKGSSTVVENGDIVYIRPEYVQINASTESDSGITAGSAVISLPENYFGTIASGGTFPKLKLTATVEIDRGKPRLKTSVTNKRIVVSASGDRVIPFRGRDYDTNDIQVFSYSDAYKLRYIYEGTSTTPPNVDSGGNLVSGTDITYKFSFDDGQRDTFYDISRIVLRPGYDAPVGQLVIGFDYFEHSQGDFCTVDSYLHEAGVGGEEVPVFNSSVHGIVSLKDVIDFRPKVDSNTIITGFQDASILSSPEGKNYINFVGSAGIPALTPAVDDNLEFTVSFSETQFLDRIDGIYLNKKGEFVVKQGSSSLNPTKPDLIDDAIALCYFYIPSYTLTSKDVRIIPVDNRRYTMRDIGKLEKRIERLEYYTTLSILEQQALNMQIKDEIGLDRFKSGFIVDNFENHGIGNLKSVDYRCAIDTQQSVLKSQVKEDCFTLKEVNVREDQRSISGYKRSGNVVTLPYSSIKLLGNDFATKTINPNPFVVIQYAGDVSVTPTIDQWYDTSIAPLVKNTNTSHYSIFLAKDDVKESLSSIANSFIINWVGTNSTFLNIDSLGKVNSAEVQSLVKSANVSSSSNVSPQNNEIGKGISSKTVNDTIVSNDLQFFARSIPVKFVVKRLKPTTSLNVFIDGRNVNRWAVPDTRFTGVAGNSLSTFGSDLVTDRNGNLSGIILIPAGRAPVQNTRWTGDAKTVLYDDNSEEIRIPTGEKTITFTSTSDYNNKLNSETYADVKFYSSGVIPENPASIVSTSVSFFKANEGVQLVNSNTDQESKPNPLAQTFKVENFAGGVFVTGVDLFFNKKDNTLPIKTYITNINTGKPGKYIVPGSESTMYPETLLKVYVTGDTDTISIVKGELVRGKNSNASGPVLKIFDKNNILVGDETSTQFQLNKEQVYTLVLSNNNGTTFVQNEELVIPSVTKFNAENNRSVALVIAKDSGKVVDLKISNVGNNYESATITIESPQLPGGSTATGTVSVSNGRIYDADISLSGRGYTEAPSVVVRGTGTGAGEAVIESVIEIDTPAVRMGVATDIEGEEQSITPTKFHFEHPVYLQNDSEYALIVETDSINYEMWASRLGETEISTSTTVNSQPLLGSVYKSQNIDNWTEDIFEDLKFNLYRAEFDTSRSAELLLTNEDLGLELLDGSPFETSVRSPTNATSELFKNNNFIVKVYHRDHGFEDEGNSYVFFKNAKDVGGISGNTLNSYLFQISNSGLDTYNIISPSRAGSNVIGGGSDVLASFNRKYEKLYAQISYLQFEGTKIDSFVKTTNVKPVDSNDVNFPSYTQTEYEKTFINQEQFFTNQKIIASRINQTLNETGNSLVYKFVLSSTVSHLSPVIDLETCSVKTSTNRIENSTGVENRFGKRYQILRFLPLYNLTLVFVGDASQIGTGVTLTGRTSKAQAEIIDIDSNTALVKLRTTSLFVNNEEMDATLSDGTTLSGLSIQVSAINEVSYNFSEGADLVAYYPQNVNVSYANVINGKIITWDSKDKEVIVENAYYPINGNYTSEITIGSAFSRLEENQSQDIFRVGDVVKTNEERYVEIADMTFDNGVDYTPETDSKNSSSLAKYVTKEISINSPGTSIDVRLTANVKNVENVKVLYRIKESSTQSNFEDINWVYFNETGVPDNLDLATPENTISPVVEKQSSYQELKYSVSDLPEFSSFAIKVIMKTDDPAYAPKIQDLRSVASY
jgi:hypothetical protein